MIEGLIEGEGEEEREREMDGEGEDMLLSKRPVVASDKKTAQQRRREQERKIKVHSSMQMLSLNEIFHGPHLSVLTRQSRGWLLRH